MNSIIKFIKKMNSQLDKYPLFAFLLYKILPGNRILFGKTYRSFYNQINFDSKINENKLYGIVNYTVKNVPYYVKKYHKLKINSRVDFENKIDFLTRDNLFQDNQDLLSEKFDTKEYEIVTTGGTSGKPSRFYLKKDRFKKEYAFFHKIWATKGYKNQLRGVIRNNKLDDNINYKINPFTRELVFDGFRNTEEYFEIIYNTLIQYKINYLQCYPSSAYHFAVIADKKKWDLSFIKGVFLSSEIFLPHQKALLKDKLKLPVISVYGHSEKLGLAVDFKGDGKYKVLNDYGYLELIDENNNVIREVGKIGEIVTTTLDNYGQPLIRYKTGDYSSYCQYNVNGACLLDTIEGRWQEMKIYNKDDTFVSPTALNLHNELYMHIEGLQYYQRIKGELEVLIIPNDSYNDAIKKKLIEHFQSRLHVSTKIEIVLVKKLIINPNGKFLILKSEVNN
jgi:phenylacetate-CoA ligase